MTPVKVPDLAKQEWLDWHEDALEALGEIKKKYKSGTKVDVDDDLYKRAMPFLLSLFNNKCAYCESLITNTHPGDVEHYRPKGRLKDANGKIVRVTLDGMEVDHPGYWWLCYEWRNLLPSCIDCNRRRKHTEQAESAGKADIFPIAGKRARCPEDPLKDENALLLNPAEEDFNAEEHFEFDEAGQIKTRSERGAETIKLLGLNLRETLVTQRMATVLNATSAMSLFLTYLMSSGAPNPMAKANTARINDMWEGRTEHTAFARLALRKMQENLAKAGVHINFPLPTA